QQLDRMVADVEEHVLEVDRVTGNAKRHDLARAAASEFLPDGEAVDQHRAMRRNVAFAYQIAATVELAHPHRQFEDRLAVCVIEFRVSLELSEEGLEVVWILN